MLGNLLSEEQGQITGTRVLPTHEGRPTVEVSFQANGTFLDTSVTDMGTYESVARPDGTLYGEGQGVITTAAGDTISWHGEGVGHFTGHGGASYRGALYFETESPKFAQVNGTAGVFEYESDESGKITSKLYEWK